MIKKPEFTLVEIILALMDQLKDQQYVESVSFEKEVLVITYANGFKSLIKIPKINNDKLKNEWLKYVNIKLLEQKSEILSQLNKRIESVQKQQGPVGPKGERGNGIRNATIDNSGHLIIKTDDNKIDAGKVNIQKIYAGGVGGGSKHLRYTNTLPTPFKVGGFKKGTKFKDISMHELITKLLYGYDLPYFDKFEIQDLLNDVEVGYTLPANEYNFEFHIMNTELLTDNSIEINKNNISIVKNLPNVSPVKVVLEEEYHDEPYTSNFEILGYDRTGSSFNKYFLINWKYKIYYGEYTEDIDDNQLPNPLIVLRATELVDNIYGEYFFKDIAYKWFCYPEILGENYVFHEISSDIGMVFDEVRKIDVINDYGLTITYNCYRTLSEIHNEFIMGVKNG